MSSSDWPAEFGLARNPCKDTLDTSLFFGTRQHEEAVVRIRLGIDDGHALILLVGASGTGKTLVSQVVLRSLSERDTALSLVFVHPGMGKGTLLGKILEDLGAGSGGRFAHQRLALIQSQALALHKEGRRLVVVIDEAHFLTADALHILRSLSNLETESEKLVSVLLIAEGSLMRRLQSPSYAALRSRVTFFVELRPLSLAETEQYIKYRLLKCGAPASDVMAKEVYAEIHRHSHGIPREINRLLYHSFMEALAEESHEITSLLVLQAAQRLVTAGAIS